MTSILSCLDASTLTVENTAETFKAKKETPQKMSAPVKIPAALSMMMKSFGIDVEKAQTLVNDFIEKSEEFISDGNLDKVFKIIETVERIDKNLILLLERKENGEPGNQS